MTNDIKSITIGSFDGIHLAHKRLIDQADMVVVIERHSGYLTPGYRRSLYTVKPCAFYIFKKIKSLSPQSFVDLLKRDYPKLEKIIVGYDFHFGVKKSGTAESLRSLFDGEVVIVDEVTMDDISVHSRTIKSYIREGDIVMTNRLLGRRYTIEGFVVAGQGLGKKELVPTLNLHSHHYQLPLEGVYATRTLIGTEWMDSVSFLGHRVTTDGSFALETHILDRELGEVAGDISLEFLSFIRANKKFDGLDNLRKAIEQDISTARQMLS